MLKLSSVKYVHARARKLNIVPHIEISQITGLEPPQVPNDPNDPTQGTKEDRSVHPFLWKELGQREPSEIRWIWDPQTGLMNVGSPSAGMHSSLTPEGTAWDGVLRGFYFPSRKMVGIRPFYWLQGTYDQWDETHQQLNADIMSTFIVALRPSLLNDEPDINFNTNVDNSFLQGLIGRYAW